MNNKNTWDRLSKNYDNLMLKNKQFYPNISNQIIPYLNSSQNVLELCCGTGELSCMLAPKVNIYEATDFSKDMIDVAHKKAHSSKLHFSIQSAEKLPYANNSFDVVVISHALHIIENSDKVMEEISRVLKPNGILYAPTFLHSENKKSEFYSKLVSTFGGFTVYHKWNQIDFLNYIRKFGFKIKSSNILNSNKLADCTVVAVKNG